MNAISEVMNSLTSEDDPEFWDVALALFLEDTAKRARFKRKRWPLYVEIGACSHWERPHQTRWTKAGGFAYPTGYCKTPTGTLRWGLPEFDWSVSLKFDEQSGCWLRGKPGKGKSYRFRAALPSRTLRHEQAAVHTCWFPYPPESIDTQKPELYGFRKVDGLWKCVQAPEQEWVLANR